MMQAGFVVSRSCRWGNKFDQLGLINGRKSSAVVPLAGICAGGAGQLAFLPRSPIRRLLSRGKTSPLPTLLHFFAPEVRCMASHSRFAVLPAPVSSTVLVSIAVWRRTRHPSGSRLVEVSPVGQTSAPGTYRAPENPRYPAVSNRDDHSSCGSPKWVHPKTGSRQRRRRNLTSRSEAICHGLRPGRISLAGCSPSRL
jgi:hypothetical protein